MNPRYPIYIVSKGRHESRYTSKALERMNVPYRIVIEPQEYEQYSSVIDSNKILTLPFSELGQGSIPARNWIWEHSIKEGHARHWILDDNIRDFERLNRNERGKVLTGAIFRASEDFVDRYTNVAIAGFEYRQFSGGARRKKPPYRLNTRIYSTILIKNDIPFRWRGLYNEDTDLSLRVLKAGWVTIIFHCFLQSKVKTMTMKGGNTDEVYKDTDNRREFAESLQRQHPDVTRVVWRYNRWHHHVDYSPFKDNRLVFREDFISKKGINNYGMRLVEVKDG